MFIVVFIFFSPRVAIHTIDTKKFGTREVLLNWASIRVYQHSQCIHDTSSISSQFCDILSIRLMYNRRNLVLSIAGFCLNEYKFCLITIRFKQMMFGFSKSKNVFFCWPQRKQESCKKSYIKKKIGIKQKFNILWQPIFNSMFLIFLHQYNIAYLFKFQFKFGFRCSYIDIILSYKNRMFLFSSSIFLNYGCYFSYFNINVNLIYIT